MLSPAEKQIKTQALVEGGNENRRKGGQHGKQKKRRRSRYERPYEKGRVVKLSVHARALLQQVSSREQDFQILESTKRSKTKRDQLENMSGKEKVQNNSHLTHQLKIVLFFLFEVHCCQRMGLAASLGGAGPRGRLFVRSPRQLSHIPD